MNTKEIKKILKHMAHPECTIEGHRVHTTLTATGEAWPAWSNTVVGIGGGFVHFEDVGDRDMWYKAHYENLNHDFTKDEKKEDEDAEIGRCVNECGPIGFRVKAA